MTTTHLTPGDDDPTTRTPAGPTSLSAVLSDHPGALPDQPGAPPDSGPRAGGPGAAAATPAAGAPASDAWAYAEIQRSAEFAALRRQFRRFVFPLTGLFLVWYFLYVLLAAFAAGFMGTEVIGNINVGLLFGLGQFVSTFAITMAYARWADRTFDPAAEELRARFEAGQQA